MMEFSIVNSEIFGQQPKTAWICQIEELSFVKILELLFLKKSARVRLDSTLSIARKIVDLIS